MKLSIWARRLFVLVLLISFTINIGYTLPSVTQAQQGPSTTRDETDEVIALIESCPYWTRLSNEDFNKADAILNVMEKISKYSIDIVRKAVEKYLARHLDNLYEIVAVESRIYILNRYLFRVPESATFENGAFGGWAGTPSQGKEMNWLWPLSYNSDGQLKLTGRFAGYFGPPYLAIAEFDYFYKTYGLRACFKSTFQASLPSISLIIEI